MVSKSMVICTFSSKILSYQRHEQSLIRENSIIITKTSSVSAYPEIRMHLDTFLKFFGNAEATTLGATRLLEEEFC